MKKLSLDKYTTMMLAIYRSMNTEYSVLLDENTTKLQREMALRELDILREFRTQLEKDNPTHI